MKWKLPPNKDMALILIAIFILVLALNSYFNFQSGNVFNPDGDTLGTRYYLSGPDPYYNMRLCEETLEKGYYPYLTSTDGDPLLNYPLGVRGGARPPLFNMIAVGTTKLIEPIVGETDALGLSMLFLPAIYGALLVFPVYGIGKELFDRKAAIIAAFLIPLIPAHIGSGHGSALSLFDHDSFVLLLFAITFYFTIKTLKAPDKTRYIYGALAGLTIAALQMTWVASQVILLLLMIYLTAQFFLWMWTSKYDMKTFYVMNIIFLVTFLVSLPYFIVKEQLFHYPTIILLASLGITGLAYVYKRLHLPGVITVPLTTALGGGVLFISYLAHLGIIGIRALSQIGDVFFGAGIYSSKVSDTIGEAHTASLSVVAMSIGPVIYYAGLVGLMLYMYKTYVDKWPKQNIFFICIAITQLWMVTTAGRFLNDTIPILVVFTGFICSIIITKINFKKLLKAIKATRSLKPIKAIHIFVVLFFAFGLFIPGSYLALDAAVPPNLDSQIFGENFSGYFGNSVSEQIQWSDACKWLANQDTDIEKPEDRPGIISWWDYGFYIVSMGEHPSVAENYQHGIPCAANFHTALSEKEATAILVIRLMEGEKYPVSKVDPKGTLTNDNISITLEKYFAENTTQEIINIMEDPEQYAPSYGKPVYKNSSITIDGFNAMYQDISAILATLPDLSLTELYLDMAETTDSIIRYYGIEQRDITGIFGVFPYLADKGVHGYEGLEDDWFKTVYTDRNTGEQFTYEEVVAMKVGELHSRDLFPSTTRQPTFFQSFIYRSYFGRHDNLKLPETKIPTYFLRHWKIAYNSPYITINKFYAGAPITGNVYLENNTFDDVYVYVIDEYGIPHDVAITENGEFAVVAPAGNITIAVGTQNNLLNVSKNIGKITDDEAMLKSEFIKHVTFDVSYGNLDITITELNQTANLTIQSIHYPEYTYEIEASNQLFTYNNLIPDDYTISLVNQTGVLLYEKDIIVYPNGNELIIQGGSLGS